MKEEEELQEAMAAANAVQQVEKTRREKAEKVASNGEQRAINGMRLRK
jgi:hypothetical protein